MQVITNIEKLDLQNGDVLLIQGEVDYNQAMGISRMLRTSGKEVLVIALSPNNKVSKLNEEQMRIYGWQKIQ